MDVLVSVNGDYKRANGLAFLFAGEKERWKLKFSSSTLRRIIIHHQVNWLVRLQLQQSTDDIFLFGPFLIAINKSNSSRERVTMSISYRRQLAFAHVGWLAKLRTIITNKALEINEFFPSLSFFLWLFFCSQGTFRSFVSSVRFVSAHNISSMLALNSIWEFEPLAHSLLTPNIIRKKNSWTTTQTTTTAAK